MSTLLLDYSATYSPWHQRHRRKLIIITIALTIAGAMWFYGPEGWLRVRRYWWARQCLNVSLPADAPLTEADPTKAAALIARDPDYVRSSYPMGSQAAIYFPRCLRNFAALGRLPLMEGGTAPWHPVVFLHERKSPGGNRRLVVVTAALNNALALTDRYMDAAALPIPSPLGKSPAPGGPRMIAFSGPWAPAIFHPGQIDAADGSHFWIAFDVADWGRDHSTAHGILDGYLKDDDTIAFSYRRKPGHNGFPPWE